MRTEKTEKSYEGGEKIMQLAFHNDTKVQKKYIERVKAHYKADEIIQGKYWENGKGCAIGCTIESDLITTGEDWHRRYEKALGIPRQLAYLEDKIFEGLSNGEAKEFPLRFLEAINIGADLSNVTGQFIIWLFLDKKDGVMQYARPDGKKAIQQVVRLYKRKIKGGEVATEEWLDARSAAYAAYAAAAAYAAYAAYAAAAAYAAYAAADAYAAYAAYAAADAYAAYAAADAYAAYAAADDVDAAAAAAAVAADVDAAAAAVAADVDARQKARSARYTKMAEKLIGLLKSAK